MSRRKTRSGAGPVSPNPLRATSAADWRAKYEQGVLARLPECGETVRLRPVTLKDLNAAGEIPDTLMPILAELEVAPAQDLDAISLSAALEEAVRFMQVVDPLFVAVVLEPKIAPAGRDPEPDEVPIHMVPVHDRVQVWRWLAQETHELELFRAEPIPNVAPVDDVPESKSEAK